MVLLDNALHWCGKCDKDYFVSCSGLKLSVDVGDDTSRKAVVLFNDTAEKFLERNMKQILVMDSAEIQALEKSLTGRMCTFILKPGRTLGEYLCDSFKFQTMPTQPPMKNKPKFGIDALPSKLRSKYKMEKFDPVFAGLPLFSKALTCMEFIVY